MLGLLSEGSPRDTLAHFICQLLSNPLHRWGRWDPQRLLALGPLPPPTVGLVVPSERGRETLGGDPMPPSKPACNGVLLACDSLPRREASNVVSPSHRWSN